MAKFKSSSESSPIMNGGIINIIASGTKITGTVNVESDFRLDGEIEGDIISKSKVVIGEKGYLKGSLECVCAEILGRVDGNIKTKDTLTLRATALVQGDVKVNVLVVEPDAKFNGACSMAKNKSDFILENESEDIDK